MKRSKIPSLASINLDDFSRRITPAGICALLTPQRLKEKFSFLAETPALFNPFLTISASLPGCNYKTEDSNVFKKFMFT